MMFLLRASIAVFFCILAGCQTGLKQPPPSLPPVAPATPIPLIKLPADKLPMFQDDGSTESLRTSAYQSLTYYRSRPASESYTLGADTYTVREFIDSLETFIGLLDNATSAQEWQKAVRDSFNVYQSAGTDAERTVTFSSYYEPTVPGRLHRTDVFRYPFYGRPPDLVDVDLGQFDPAYQGARIAGRRVGNNLVPYHTRAEIDSAKVLKERGKPIAWAKTPVDILFLQIEGSGWLDLGKGRKVRIRYDGNNGRKFRSIGLHLISSGRIPKDQFSHDEFERYLNTHTKERQALLNFNPRYIFFRLDRSSASVYAYGNIQVPLTDHRSIATDPKIFPKGGLAWIETDHPILDDQGKTTGIAPLTRFMLNQDEGGAIQGPGRVDYFAGSGDEAHRFATHFWQKGKLYFLVKKREP